MTSSGDERWSLGVRVIHWTLAVGLVLNLFVLEEGDPPHRWIGYAMVAAVLVRLVWGLRAQLPAPHNLAAKLVYRLIWLLVIALGVSGWMMGLDAFWGDERVEDVHEIFSQALMLLIALHLLGLAKDSLVHRRKTWMAMISGRRD
jgi:cytochrome b